MHEPHGDDSKTPVQQSDGASRFTDPKAAASVYGGLILMALWASRPKTARLATATRKPQGFRGPREKRHGARPLTPSSFEADDGPVGPNPWEPAGPPAEPELRRRLDEMFHTMSTGPFGPALVVGVILFGWLVAHHLMRVGF
jgi:hypothetical protein